MTPSAMGFSHALLLGFALGARHALEPDHLAAITTLAARTTTARGAASMGAAWGLGHAIAVVLLGSVVLASGVRVPLSVALALDLAVAAVLVWLGVQALFSRDAVHSEPHRHQDCELGHLRRPTRSTLVGFVHGASGTAAITLICLTTFRSFAGAVSFLVLFALGAWISMSLLSGVLAGPLAALARRDGRASRILRVGGGVAALAAAVGVAIAALGAASLT